jgi:hypothetical protein
MNFWLEAILLDVNELWEILEGIGEENPGVFRKIPPFLFN